MKLGERLDATFQNNLPREGEHTSVHWHGMRIANAEDGVPYLTQRPVWPGESYSLQLRAARHRHLLLPSALRHRRAARPRAWPAADRRGRRDGALRRRRADRAARLAVDEASAASCPSSRRRAPARPARSARSAAPTARPIRRSCCRPAAIAGCASQSRQHAHHGDRRRGRRGGDRRGRRRRASRRSRSSPGGSGRRCGSTSWCARRPTERRCGSSTISRRSRCRWRG